MKKIIFIIFCACGAFLALPIVAQAATYYVRTDGNNNCSGLVNVGGASGECAWRTLQYAADTVVAGDTVNVADGNYVGFMIQTAGTLGAPITFQSIGDGANITTRNATTPDGINIESWGDDPADYIIIDGFNVYNQPRMGVRAIGGTGIVVQNTVAHDNDDCGIFTGWTPNFSVLNTTTYNNGSTLMQHNIYISNSTSDNPIVRGNIAYDSGGGNGIQLNGDWESDDFPPVGDQDGFIDNALIENNILYGNYAKGFSLISVRNSMIRNNITYNNGIPDGSAGGIHIVQQMDSHYSSGNTVVNNTMDEPAVACVRINALNTANVVFNNICLGNSGIVFEGSGNFESNNSNSTAGFTNRASHNYTLLEGAVQIGAGLALYQSRPAPTTDFLGTARPQGGTYDIGAYEYIISSGDTVAPVSPSGLSVL